ncbi:MAG: hypothetical protein AUK47_22785 [Deltaproteobacteria bacterium CG2_30_63_29]|nr:MAG: hypothetical protein AUK47_22785 [Deltaproteobacteria bacterium CG2_30_63_29]PIV98375.1 MAG: 2-hydroxyhepta-2,4-diene-1,7-dioate isomerase [Deltaproteobacteria bacterium CG17_big_fil_post_rev_8_21_14_2_50_63_7]
MKIARVQTDRGIWYAQLEPDGTASLIPLELAELHEVLLRRELPAFEERIAPGGYQLLAPSTPSKIVCVGLNYRRHAEEMGKTIPTEPLIFLKPSTAAIGPNDQIVLPEQSKQVEHEGELAIVIGRRAKQVGKEGVPEVVFGFTALNDVTARDIQQREQKYTHGKGFDTFAPFGPWIETNFEPKQASVSLTVDGQVRQQSCCDDLIFDVPTIVSFISGIMTLLPGDVIATGTPSGVGALLRGQVVEVTITGIGTLSNPVG